MKKVTIYTTPTCAYCKMAKDYFVQNNVDYTELDVAKDVNAQQEMIKKSGQLGVPVIAVSDGKSEKLLIGYNKSRLDELLKG